jgi:uncharacterized protein YbaP (TraB family)
MGRFRRVLVWLAILVLAPWLRPALAGELLPYSKGLLWSVEAADAAPSYIFGTIHSADPRVTNLAPEVAQALAAAESITLELVDIQVATEAIKRAGRLADGRSLDALVGPEMFKNVAATGAGYGLPADVLKTFKPWMVVMVFSMPPFEIARLAHGAVALDNSLGETARRGGKAIVGLESAEEQIAVFDEMPERDQIALLEFTLNQAPDTADTWERMTRSYLAGDLAALYDLMMEQTRALGTDSALAFKRRVLDMRNERMANRLDKRLRRGGAFVAVGALHLPGRAGLLRLLEGRGFRINRLY